MRTIISAVFAASLVLAPAAFAAKPVSIKFAGASQTAEGASYELFEVKCSNKSKPAITKWDEPKQWCVGAESTESCKRSKMRAATLACRAK